MRTIRWRVARSIIFLAAATTLGRATLASNVRVTFEGTISFVTSENGFEGFFSVGDSYQGVLTYDSDNTVVVADQGVQKFYALGNANLTVEINGAEFTRDATAPILMLVRNFPTSVDGIDIDVSTVPVDAARVPLAPGPHAVTDLRFALQDNSGTALDSTQVPDAESPIWNANVQRLDFIGDPLGACANGICNDSETDGAAIGQTTSLEAVPEPSTLTLAAFSVITLAVWGSRRK